MSVYYTTKINRKQAIDMIVEKRIETVKKDIEYALIHLTNKELEEVLDKYEFDNEYENFSIEDKVESEVK